MRLPSCLRENRRFKCLSIDAVCSLLSGRKSSRLDSTCSSDFDLDEYYIERDDTRGVLSSRPSYFGTGFDSYSTRRLVRLSGNLDYAANGNHGGGSRTEEEFCITAQHKQVRNLSTRDDSSPTKLESCAKDFAASKSTGDLAAVSFEGKRETESNASFHISNKIAQGYKTLPTDFSKPAPKVDNRLRNQESFPENETETTNSHLVQSNGFIGRPSVGGN